MTLKEQLEKCPKAKDKYYDFVFKALSGFQQMVAGEIPKDTEVEIPAIDEGFIHTYADSILNLNPRFLYDFFDRQEIWVVVDYDYDRIDAPEWFHKMTGEASAYFKTRLETETAAFIKAFSILEEKLNNGENS